MRTSARTRYAGYRFPAEIIGHGVWLYFRFSLGLRMVEELLAARGIIVSHETVRQWARKFGQPFANQIRRRLPRVGDKWHLDEVRSFENSDRCSANRASPRNGMRSALQALQAPTTP
jgi:putative transposase